MFGAVIGDVIGSPYISKQVDSTNFGLLSKESKFTEITVMTLAVAEAVMHAMPTQGIICEDEIFRRNLIFWMKKFGRKFAHIHYGRKFYKWLHVKKSLPYESSSNGAALRISPIAFAFDNITDVERFAEIAARVTTKTDESIKLARTLAGMIFLARMKKDKDEIKNYFLEQTGINFLPTLEEFYAKFNFLSIEGIRTSCCDSIQAALASFIENENFENSVRTAVYLGGETSETASMAGALAETYSGVKILTEVLVFAKIHKRLRFTVEKWEQWKNE